MIYLTALGLFVWLLGYADDRTGLRQHNYKNYLLIAGSVVALMMGLRTQYTGSTDTYMYAGFYKGIVNYRSFIDYYNLTLSDVEFVFSETGFYLFMWLLSRVFSDPQILILVTSSFITYSACRFIYKNSNDVPTSMVAYVCLGLFTFNMNGMRQAMAMAICLFAYEFVKQRKLIPFLLTVFLAMQFHKTALCFFPIYLMPVIQTSKGNTFWYFVGMFAFVMAMDWIIETFNAFAGEDYLVSDQADGGGISVIMIYALAIILSLFMHRSLKDKNIRMQFYIVVLGLACYITRFFNNQVVERLSYYFFYFSVLLIPNIINELSEQERKIVKLGFGFLAVVLLWYRVQFGALSSFRLFFM